MEGLIRLPLQYFAEDGGAIGAARTVAEDGANGQGAEYSEQKPQTLDEVLAGNKNFQAEFDRRMTKGIETARAKWDEQKKAEMTEQEKLAKMKADEKAQYEREKAEKRLMEREAEVTRRELTATAKETLVEKGLSADLAAVLNYSNADTCKESLEAVEKAVRLAAESIVNSKLKSDGAPKKGAENSEVDPFLAALRGK